jgi:hypothetical protein
LGQNPATGGQDQPGLLEPGDELEGADHAADGMAPPQQRLNPDGGDIREAESGLVLEKELAAVQSGSQVCFEHKTVLDCRVL